MDRINLERILILLIAFSIIIAISGFYADYVNTRLYGGVDLRERIVGARLLRAGYSPYYFKWGNGLSEKLLDPSDRQEHIFSRTIAPPSQLLLLSVICEFGYYHIRFGWLYFQYFCILFIIFAFLKISRSVVKRYLILITGLLFFMGSPSWHYHVERGQFYILYIFLFSSAFFLTQTSIKAKNYLSGFIIGLSIWLRPPIVMILIPLIINKKWEILKGILLSFFSLLVIVMIFTRFSNWTDYYSTLKEWGKVQTKEVAIIQNNVQYPAIIEGMDNLAKHANNIASENSSIQALAYKLLKVKLSANVLLFLFVGSIALLWILLGKDSYIKPDASIFLIGFLMIMLAEYFIPAPRTSYNYIQWIFPVLLVILKYDIMNNISLPFLFIGLLFNLDTFNWIRFNLTIGEVFLFIGIFILIKSKAVSEDV